MPPTPTRARRLLGCLLAFVLAVAVALLAAPGASADSDLDATFAAGGVAGWDATNGGRGDEVTALEPAGSGRTWVLSSSMLASGLYGAELSLVDASGALVTSFGGDGSVNVMVGAGQYSPAAVLPRAGGGAFVVGTASDSSVNAMPAIVAVEDDGTIDSSWGSAGTVTWPLASTDGFIVADAAIVGSDIVVAGWNQSNTSVDANVRVLTSDLTGAWGSGMRAATNLDIDGHDHVVDIAEGPASTLLLAGFSNTMSGESPWVVRLEFDGTTDEAWAGDGIADIDIDSPASLTPDGGQVLVSGRTLSASGGPSGPPSNEVPAVIRLLASGQPDASFGTAGVASFAVPGAVSASAAGTILRADGTIFVAGTALPSSGASSGDPSDAWYGVIEADGTGPNVRLDDLSGGLRGDGISAVYDVGAAGSLVGGFDDRGASTGRDTLLARIIDVPDAVAPVSVLPPGITGSTNVGSTLSCVNGTWDNAPTSFAYAWFADGTPIGGATAATYVLAQSVGTVITCRVTGSNTAGSDAATSAGITVTSPATGPANTTRPVVSGLAEEGAALSCFEGTWAGTPTAWAFQWTANGTPITGEVASTYTVLAQPVGTQVRCLVTAYDVDGSTTVASDPVTIALPAPPTNDVVPVITGDAEQGSTVMCDTGTWIGSPTAFDYAWTANGIPLAGETSPTYLISAAAGTSVRCAVTATNAGGSATATSSALTVTPQLAPTNTDPPTIIGDGEVGSMLTCIDGTWTSYPTFTYAWTADGVTLAGETTSSYAVTASPGALIRCEVTATNGAGTLTVTTAPVTVTAVVAPSNSTPPTINGSSVELQDVTCDPGTWAGSAVTSWTYQWYADGVALGWGVDPWINLNQGVGTVMTCEVTANNGGGSDTAVSAPLTITAMLPPASTSLPVLNGNTDQGSELSCSDGSWDYWPTSYTYAWFANGAPIAGASLNTYTLAEAAGTSITCEVTAINYVGSSSATSDPVVVTTLLAPTNDYPPDVWGSTDEGEDLSCTDGTWTPAPTAYAYQWLADGTPIPGATLNTWTISEPAGTNITCEVTASNAAGSNSASSTPLTVTPAGSGGATGPVNSGWPVINGSDSPGSTISCTTGTWLGDPTAFGFAWTADGVAIPGATSPTLVISQADGTAIVCEVTAFNATGSAMTASSPLYVTSTSSSAPTNTVVPSIGGSAGSGATLTCSSGSWSGSPTSYAYAWTANGSPIPGATSSAYVVAEAAGVQLRCEVTATNALGSTTATSSAVTVTATPAPANTVLPAITGSTTVGSTLSCSTGTWTGSPTSWAYRWTADGVTIPGGTAATHVIGEAAGVQVRCEVTATNAGGSSSATSAAITVTGGAPAAPTNSALPTISGSTTAGSTLTCADGTWTGSPTGYTYAWTANGSTIGGATSSTYVISQSVGTLIRCIVTATNATGSTSATSAATTVTVAAPVNTSPPAIPTAILVGSTPTCTPGSWTPAATSYSYQWYADGSPISGETGSTHLVNETAGVALSCLVVATNAGGSDVAMSNIVTVQDPDPGPPLTNTALPTISGATTAGSTLTCSTGTWSEPPTSYAYAWTANGATIAGATSSTYVIVESVGTQLRCVVTAATATDSATATSAATTVTVAAPVNTAAPGVSGSTTAGSTLACTTGSWTPAATSFAYAWTADGSPIAGATSSTYVIAQAVGVQVRCVVTATNAGGSNAATSSAVTVTASPTPPANTALPTISGATTGGSTLTCATGTWTNSPTGYAYAWTANGTTIGGATSSTYVISQSTGTLIRCIVTASNASGSASATSAATTVTVAAPVNTAVPTVSGSTSTGSTLACTTGSWTPAATSYAYAWTADGATIAGVTSSTYVIVEGAGAQLRCIVTATNAGGSNAATSAATTVTLAAPTNSALPTISGSTTAGSTLTCANGTWTGSPTLYTYAWTANGATIPGATSSTYVISQSVGTQLRCVVTATNAGGSASATSAATVVTLGPPTNTAAPTIGGSTSPGSTLSCSPGSWTPAATSYAYAWTADGSTIGGATSSTYVISQSPGTQLACIVTATNAAGSNTATSAPSTVGVAPPTNSTVPTISGSTTTGSTLTCDTGTWTGSPTGYVYAWSSNGVAIAGATASTYVITQAPGAQLRCTVTATNAGGSAAASSAVTTVTLAPPSNTAAPSVTGATIPGSTITCSPGTWSPAATLYGYAWTADGVTIAGASSSTYSIAEAVGVQLRCVVTATNGAGSGTATSAPLTVTQAPPGSVTLPAISGGTAPGSTLTCDGGTWSGSPSLAYAWTADGSPIGGATSSTHLVTQSIGTQLRCVVTATNAGGSATATSAAVTVSSTPAPANSVAPVLTGATNIGSVLSCTPGTWTGSPTYAYAWTADGAPIAGAASATFTTTQAAGTQIRCVVTATNVGGNATATSNAITVTFTPPPANTAAPSVSGSARTGTLATCSLGSWTGSPTSFTYEWSANGVPIGGAVANSLVISQAAGVQLRCSVTASNATGSTSATSAPVTVTENPPINTAAPSIGGSLTIGSTLTCSPGSWTGSPTLAYGWAANGAPIPGANASTYTITQPTGTRIRCEVMATNVAGGANANSELVTVEEGGATRTLLASTAPAVQTLAGRPAGAYVGGIVRCNPGTWRADEQPTFTYSWTVGSTRLAGASDAQLVVPAGTAGRQLTCTVVASAGGATATARSVATTIAAFRLITGTARADTKYGSTGNDRIVLRGGSDTARALAGDDQLFGEDGNDSLLGGIGRDRLHGGRGADRLYGDGGNDVIDARDASSTIDVVSCGAGRDVAYVNRRDRVTGCETVRRFA